MAGVMPPSPRACSGQLPLRVSWPGLSGVLTSGGLWPLVFQVCDCAFGLVLLLLEQIKPIEQLVPVS